MNYRKTILLWGVGLTTFCLEPALGQVGMSGMRRPGMGSMAGQTGPSRPIVPNIAGELANKEVKWLKENLTLSKEQAKEVKKLYNDYAEQQQAAIRDIVGPSGQPGPDTGKQIQDMMLMLNEEKEDKLKPILTTEQWQLYQSKKEDMQRAVGGFRPPAVKTMQAKPDSAGRQ